MSDGLKLIAAAIDENKAARLLALPLNLFIEGRETQAIEYVRAHYETYHELPRPETVRENCGINLPRHAEDMTYYVTSCANRLANNSAKVEYRTLREALEGVTSRDVSAAETAAERLLQALRQRHELIGGSSRGISASVGLNAVRERVIQARLSSGGVTGITTGWAGLDRLTSGWQNGDLNAIIARPKMGKTWVLMYSMLSAWTAGNKVVVGTTEMTPEQMYMRLACLYLGIDPMALRRGRVSNYTLSRIEEFSRLPELQSRWVVIPLGFKSSVNEMRRAVDVHDPHVIGIDGVYMLQPSDDRVKRQSKHEQVTYVNNELKDFALDADRPVVVTSQFNRQAGRGGKDASLETVGFSDSLVQVCSVILALKYGTMTEDESMSREIELLAQRDGVSDSIHFNFNLKRADLSEIVDPDARIEDDEDSVVEDAEDPNPESGVDQM
jgi:replicative DNA helicase